jgi:short-subunit dehydrogenase
MPARARPTTALVTGASAGIGRELVRQLTRDRGTLVLATARRWERLEQLVAECPAGRVRILSGDLSDPAFRQALWTEAERLPGRCQVLFNNAGIGHYSRLAEESLEAIERQVATNIVAVVDLTRLALGSMLARGEGQIVQIASILSVFGIPYSAVYVATKHAVLGLVRSLRGELRGTGVRVWAACPGRTTSEFASVAAGRSPEILGGRQAEPVERVVRGILAGLDRSRSIWFPTWRAWAVARAATWLSWPFSAVLDRWAPAHFQRELESDRGRASASDS